MDVVRSLKQVDSAVRASGGGRHAAGFVLRRISLAALLFLGLVRHAPAHELLLFPRLSYATTSAHAGADTVDTAVAAASAFYANDFGRLRTLAEVNFVYETDGLSAVREREIERLQVGWKVGIGDSVWIGRYHSPLGYWNVEYHHGSYLQTAVSRPRIVEFEDGGGPLSMHYAGLLWQGTRAIVGDGAFSYDLGAASGPSLTATELEPVQLEDRPRWGKPVFVGRLTYKPDATGEDQFGVFFAHERIPVREPAVDELRQQVAGGFVNLEFSRGRTLAELFYVRTLQRDAGTRSAFVAGYVQGELKAVHLWTPFARVELTSAGASDPYLSRIDDFPKSRVVGGLRFDIAPKHALTLELVRHRSLDGTAYRQVGVQWSAVLP